MDGYSRGGRAKYSMKVHVIFVTKYRKKGERCVSTHLKVCGFAADNL